MEYRNSVVSKNGYLYNLAIDVPPSDLPFVHENEGLIIISHDVVVYVEGPDDEANNDIVWLNSFGYPYGGGGDVTLRVNVIGGGVAATVDGEPVQLPYTGEIGTIVHLEVTPNQGYRFVRWSDGSVEAVRDIALYENLTLTATCELITYTISADMDHGTVTATVGGNPVQLPYTDVPGTELVLTANADQGYEFTWWVDGYYENPRTLYIDSNKNLHAESRILSYTLNVSMVNGSVNATVDGVPVQLPYTAEYGTIVHLEAIPDEGYHFVSWSDGVSTIERDVVLSSNKSIVGTCAQTTYTLNVGVVNGSVNATVAGIPVQLPYTAASGTEVTLLVNADTGYVFERWNDGSTANPRIVIMTSDITLMTTCAPVMLTLEASVVNGSVSATVGGSPVQLPYQGTYGTEVSLEVLPNSGYEFERWSDGDTSNPRLVTLIDNISLTATCIQTMVYHTVSFSCQYGSVSATVDGMGIQSGESVLEGKTVVFTITPNAHYHYYGTNPESVVVNADVVRNYVCSIDTFVVTFSCANGSVGATVDGIGIQSGESVAYGKTAIFTITPNEGYQYTGENPEYVVVNADVTRNYVCTPAVPRVITMDDIELEVAGTASSIAPGTYQLENAIHDTAPSGNPYTFEISGESGIVTVDESNLATAVGKGVVQVRASCDGVTSDWADISVYQYVLQTSTPTSGTYVIASTNVAGTTNSVKYSFSGVANATHTVAQSGSDLVITDTVNMTNAMDITGSTSPVQPHNSTKYLYRSSSYISWSSTSQNWNIATTYCYNGNKYYLYWSGSAWTVSKNTVNNVYWYKRTTGALQSYPVTFACTNGSVSATVDGMGIQSGDLVLEGKSVVFTITPNDGYQYTGTNPETVVVGSAVSKNYTCTLIPTYAVNFSCTNGSVGATVDGIGIQSGDTVRKGKTVIFTITPDEGYEYTGTNPESVVVNSAITKSYVCTEIPVYHTVTFSCQHGSVGATVDGVGIQSGDQVLDGKTVEFTITPDSYYEYLGENPESVVVNDDVTRDYVCTPLPMYTVTFSCTNGSVGATVDGIGIQSGDQVYRGSVVTFTITPDEDYQYIGTNPESVVIDTDITKNYVCTLISVYHTVTFSCTHGSVGATVGGIGIQSGDDVPEGSTVIFTITPDEGYDYIGENPEYVIVTDNIIRNYECTPSTYHRVYFYCENGSVTATVDGVEIHSGDLIHYGKIVIFNITPNEGYSYLGSNPTFVIVRDEISRRFTCVASTWSGLKFYNSSREDSGYVRMYQEGTFTGTWPVQISRDDGVTWSDYTISLELPIAPQEIICFRGYKDSTPQSFNVYRHFAKYYPGISYDGSIYTSGDVTSLLNGVGGVTDLTPYGAYTFCNMFRDSGGDNVSLPSTTLTDHCYAAMFWGNGTQVMPELPATTLAPQCYMEMFRNSYLYLAFNLPATTLAPECYERMFEDCNNLRGTITISATSPYYNNIRAVTNMFLDSYSEGGTINVAGGYPSEWIYVMGANRSSWNVVSDNWTGLKFTSTGDSTISYNEFGTWEGTWPIEVSFDNVTWTSYTLGTIISLADAESIYFRGNKDSTTQTSSGYRKFVMTGSIAASGDVTSMLNGVGGYVMNLTPYGSRTFGTMFQGCTSLTSAPDLPATTLARSCYFYMFSSCTGLTTAPSELPATTLATDCYASMFTGCTSLTGPVNISASSPYSSGTTSACSGMFYNSGTSRPSTPTDYNKINVGGNVSRWNSTNAGIDSTYWTVELITEETPEEQ